MMGAYHSVLEGQCVKACDKVLNIQKKRIAVMMIFTG